MYILITYYSAGAQGSELQLAIAGWRKYYQDKYTIVVVSDINRYIAGDDIIWITEPRVSGITGQYHPHLDVMNRFFTAIRQIPDMKEFVWAADDNFLVKPLTEAELRKLRYQNEEYTFSTYDNLAPFAKEKLKTRRLLEAEGLPNRNYTTHIPCLFEVDKLTSLTDKYDLTHNSYILEDLYYNTYLPNAEAELAAKSKYFLVKHDDAFSLTEKLEDKTWICTSVQGFSESMQNILAAYYGINLIRHNVMFKKTYQSKRTELFLSVMLGNGKSKRISFNLASNGMSSFTTTDKSIQDALERHVGFNKSFTLIESTDLTKKVIKVEPVKNVEKKPATMKDLPFKSMADAKEYVADKWEVPRTKLNNMFAIIAEGKKRGFNIFIQK